MLTEINTTAALQKHDWLARLNSLLRRQDKLPTHCNQSCVSKRRRWDLGELFLAGAVHSIPSRVLAAIT